MLNTLADEIRSIKCDVKAPFEEYRANMTARATKLNQIDVILNYNKKEYQDKIKSFNAKNAFILNAEEIKYMFDLYGSDIKKYSELSTSEQIVLKVMTVLMAKDPSRQSLDERCQFDYLHNTFSNSIKLPVSKDNDGAPIYYGNDGSIVTADDARKATRSLDFHTYYRGYTILTSAKYTDKKGTSQEHQYEELINFAKQAVKNTDEKQINVILADGEFYRKRLCNGSTRMDKLKEICAVNERCIVITSNQWPLVKKRINRLIKKQKETSKSLF